MTTEHESTERFLWSVKPLEHEAPEHQRQLRGQILAQLQARQSRAAARRGWKIALLLLGLIGVGALAAEIAIQVHQYFYMGRDKDGAYLFETERQTLWERTYTNANGQLARAGGSRGGMTSFGAGNRELSPAEIEQKRRDLEEIQTLGRQGRRELMRAVDTVVNGKPLPRACVFKYTLADGRTETMGESSPESEQTQPAIPTEQDLKEIDALRQQRLREVTRVMETEVNGQLDRTLFCHYVLRDGREMDVGEADPDLQSSGPSLTLNQQDEMFRLKNLGRGQVLEPVQKEVFGKVFNLERFLITLADGTVVTYSEGEPAGLKTSLTKADWEELRKLIQGRTGEALGQYSEAVLGRVFQFTRARYVLSDGTQVIQSTGEPADR